MPETKTPSETEPKAKGSFHFYYNEDLKEALVKWHRELEKNKRDRAILRRIDDPRDALLTRSFADLKNTLLAETKERDLGPKKTNQLALAACLLVHVPGHNDIRFGEALANGDVKDLRFQRLFFDNDRDDPHYIVLQFDALRRMIKLCGEPFNIAQFTQDLLDWPEDHHKKIQMRWSQHFYNKKIKQQGAK
jgi:CRISPR type I-E-associated protein CasB/Cse2